MVTSVSSVRCGRLTLTMTAYEVVVHEGVEVTHRER